RIDKRGMFGSSRAVPDPNAVTIADYATDIHNWVKVIRAKTGVSCVWLAGHSEGGIVALTASQSPADICGLILLATPGRPAGEVLKDQVNASIGNTSMARQVRFTIDTLQAGNHIGRNRMHPDLVPMFGPHLQNYLISLFKVAPAQLAADFK